MLTSVQGIYRNGKIQLTEVPHNVTNDTVVIVTFLTTGDIDLASRGIGKEQAADLRARLSTFADEWDNPEMDIYDDYDAAKSKL